MGMNGELAQLVSLAAYGNVYLGWEDMTPPELVGTNTMFNFSHVKFVRDPEPYGDGMRGTLVATGTAEWYVGLRELGARNICLVRRGEPVPEDLSRHVLVAFAGGGDWHLQVNYFDKSEVWAAAWKFVNKGGDGQGSHWDVTYAGVPVDTMPAVEKHDLNEMEARLQRALADVEQFAREHGEENWADVFKRELGKLDGGQAQADDMLPQEGYSSDARRLLSSASGAWVFGGMGSWNDIYFDDEQARADYNRLSAELYDAVLAATIAATNSFKRPL
jgi:hypothetical protein